MSPSDRIRYSINSWIYPDLELRYVLKRLSILGYDGVEIAVAQENCKRDFDRNTKRTLEESRLKPATVFCSDLAKRPEEVSLDTPTNEIRMRTVNYVKACIDFAECIGAKTVILATSPTRTDVPRETSIVCASENFGICADYASEKEVTLALEHFVNRLVDKTDALLRMIKTVNSKSFKGLLDTGHLNVLREGLSESVRKLGDLIAHVHFNNNDGKNDTHRPLLEGTINLEEFQGFVKALKEVNYGGYYSFEIINVQDPDRVAEENRALLEKLILTS